MPLRGVVPYGAEPIGAQDVGPYINAFLGLMFPE